MADWVSLPELKADLKIDDGRDDEALTSVLAAAMAFVERARPGFNYGRVGQSTYPAPPADLVLGTLRLAGRWHSRRRSPDGLVDMGEFGTSRVAYIDPDIERLLRIGRYRRSVVA